MVKRLLGHISGSSKTALLLFPQVQVALQGASLVCLPRLETLELYSYTDGKRGGPSFQLGSSLAHQQGARGVCMEIGSLVAVIALPSLKQVERT